MQVSNQTSRRGSASVTSAAGETETVTNVMVSLPASKTNSRGAAMIDINIFYLM